MLKFNSKKKLVQAHKKGILIPKGKVMEQHYKAYSDSLLGCDTTYLPNFRVSHLKMLGT
jgi:hypothetical protein